MVDGIIGGVGTIVTFLPNILILFLCLALLEDSGYMARVAYVMEDIMSKLGLSGKAFIPCYWDLAVRFPPSWLPVRWKASGTASRSCW